MVVVVLVLGVVVVVVVAAAAVMVMAVLVVVAAVAAAAVVVVVEAGPVAGDPHRQARIRAACHPDRGHQEGHQRGAPQDLRGCCQESQ